jgi:spermidine/putrescine transport system permease protein
MAKRQSWWLWAAAALAYVFLYLPLVIVVVYSFNDSKLNAEWVGFTLDWYHKLFNNREMLVAARNSMVIGVVSALAATFFGALAGIAMHRYKLRLLPFLVLTPIAIPEILMGVSLLIFFVLLNVTLGMTSIILAHVAFCIGFVAIVVRARMQGMDNSLVEAARDLGATPWQAFRLVTLPCMSARTTIATKPMQNATWARMIEVMPRVTFSNTKKISRLTPIRISGMAIGVSTRKGSRRSL